MAWEEEIREASFRGVSFSVKAAKSSFGRELIRHRYPGRDRTYNEDTGRKPRDFQVEGFLVGPDHLQQLDDLIEAVEREGAGVLIHPYYGEILVDCVGFDPQHETDESGMVRFSLDFMEAGSKDFLRSRDDTAAQAGLSVEACLKAQGDAFEKRFGLTGVSGKYLDAVFLAIQKAAIAVAKVRQEMGVVPEFLKAVQDIVSSAASLAQDAGALVNTFVDIVGLGIFDETWEDIVQDRDNKAKSEFFKDAMRRLAGLWGYDSGTQYPSDPTQAITDLLRVSAINAAVMAATQANYESVEEAHYFRDLLTKAIDGILLSDMPDDIFPAMEDLRAKCVKDLDARAANLPSITELTLSEDTPSLILTFRLYGSVDMEEDVLRRNNLDDPSFIPSGVPIKVLVNG